MLTLNLGVDRCRLLVGYNVFKLIELSKFDRKHFFKPRPMVFWLKPKSCLLACIAFKPRRYGLMYSEHILAYNYRSTARHAIILYY